MSPSKASFVCCATGGDSKSVCPPLKFKLTAEGRVQMIPDSAAAVDYCLAIPVRLALL
jgi:hypothetical protein|eukprot:COSAG06_NODE_2330_length_7074_cov_69.860072_8_plen_58_part_00